MRISSERLVLRPWIAADRQPFADMSADREVMEYLMPLSPHDASGGWIDRQLEHLQEHGMCFWAVERKSDQSFVGAVGLLPVSYTAHFTPAVEIGWRIARAHWGKGYAPEAARAAIRFGFEELDLSEIVANTVAENVKSRRVMAKLEMTRDASDDFDHPRIPEGHSLRRQVLYRLTQKQWRSLAP
ncbi:GNAT family N-acetyltransferase [Acidisphaera sp. S103]|uniref:GNAT family N-acetyltransferase n=1 Tax=Acidisphaera sp. S103 TaxID=1747223 RepID=UPI00131C0DD6|nr:GNAT family N-acetyltransferase [Acidisphaera sp. S103]